MNFYSLAALINVITSVILGVFVFSRNPQDRRYQTFLYFCLSVALWSMFYFTAQIAFDRRAALWCFRALMLGAIFIPVCYLHYLLVFLDVYRRREKFIYYGYLGAVVFAGLNLTDFFITGVSRKLVFSYWPDIGFAFYPFFVLWIAYFFRGVQVLFVEYRKSTGFRRNQLRYVLLATSIGALGGATNIPLWFNIPLLPFANILVSGYMFILTYAILKYRLMDISVAVTRTGIFVVLYTFILGLPFAAGAYFKDLLVSFLGPNWWFVPLGLMAVMATVGPFLYIFLEHRAEKSLLRDQLRYQHTIRQASVGMTRVRSLSRLLNLIAHIITKTVKISFAAIYLYEQKDREYVLQIVRNSQRAFLVRIPAEAPLVSWIAMRRQSLIYEEIKILAEDSFDPVYERLEENMRVLGAALAIPCFLEDKLLAVIFLGDKVSGQQYTPDDLNVFQILASQAAMAIENAQFYEETRKMQEQIAQAEKMATIGTMADGLSHQINNRFHTLSLIAQDTIDTISRTDASKCAPEIQNMVGAINHALERIKVNVMRGGEVAKGILKYTRTQQEGLEVLALDDVLNAAVEMVQYKIKLSEVDIVRDYPKDLPKLRGNFVQLEEAFFNFIDNGYDAIMELKNSSLERGYRGRIIISAKAKTSDIMEIVVADNGIGIKSQHLDKVFTPFFTTKVSARKGTGLGLYVIRRIITDAHKGKIRFESEYRMGTRFFLELPISGNRSVNGDIPDPR